MQQSAVMSLKTFKAVAQVLPPRISVMARADHGLGKSSAVRQIRAHLKLTCRELDGHEFPIIDQRVSQLTEGDILGLPSIDGAVTRFNPPHWYMRGCLEPIVLHLDEFNRGTNEVMQACFQIALDRELSGHKLHPLTRVFTSVNVGHRYNVTSIDPALLDRFFVADINMTVEEWCEWALSTDPIDGGNLDPIMAGFMKTSKTSSGSSWLFPPENAEASSVHGTPRSWHMMHDCLKAAGVFNKPSDPTFYQICMGFVGVEAAIAFKDYVINEAAQWSGEDIVNGYATHPEIRRKVQGIGQGAQNEIIDRVAGYILNTPDLEEITPAQGENLRALVNDLHDEMKLALWSKLVQPGMQRINLIKSFHPFMNEAIVGVFGVKVGEAGVGMVPNIPEMFNVQSSA